jgi:WD40 repeat protein
LEGHTANVTSVGFHHASKWIVTGSEDGTLKIWDLRARGPQRDYSHKCPVNDVVIHPNQGELISCDQNGSVKIWDLGGNQCTHELVYTFVILVYFNLGLNIRHIYIYIYIYRIFHRKHWRSLCIFMIFLKWTLMNLMLTVVPNI